jgi:hypothetical protein
MNESRDLFGAGGINVPLAGCGQAIDEMVGQQHLLAEEAHPWRCVPAVPTR